MMRGFSLLECLTATTFFLVILLAGYEALDSQNFLFSQIRKRTRPEEESNYRLLLLESLLRNGSEKLRLDPMLEQVPFFFPDLHFGGEPASNSLSVAHPVGTPVRFRREDNMLFLPPTPRMKAGQVIALGGGTADGSFEWNYGRILDVRAAAKDQTITVDVYLAKAPLDYGCLIEVEIRGLLFQNNGLYWITPAGQAAPYFLPMDDFHYEWRAPELTIYWKTGLVEAQWKTTL